jgi:hypothetical protein
LEFTTDLKFGNLLFAGRTHIIVPGSYPLASQANRHGFIVRQIVHFPAKGIQRSHTLAFGLGQQDEGKSQIGSALSRDPLADLHALGRGRGRGLCLPDGGQAACLSQCRIPQAMLAAADAAAIPVAILARNGGGFPSHG